MYQVLPLNERKVPRFRRNPRSPYTAPNCPHCGAFDWFRMTEPDEYHLQETWNTCGFRGRMKPLMVIDELTIGFYRELWFAVLDVCGSCGLVVS